MSVFSLTFGQSFRSFSTTDQSSHKISIINQSINWVTKGSIDLLLIRTIQCEIVFLFGDPRSCGRTFLAARNSTARREFPTVRRWQNWHAKWTNRKSRPFFPRTLLDLSSRGPRLKMSVFWVGNWANWLWRISESPRWENCARCPRRICCAILIWRRRSGWWVSVWDRTMKRSSRGIGPSPSGVVRTF